jgi:AcrR family transcriptional regulator
MGTNSTTVSDKRSAILETTLDLLSKRGFHDTPMSAIAKESGVSTGIIYHYFANKEELIYELYKEIKYNMIQAVLEGHSEQAPYRERFLLWWRQLVRYYIDHPKEANFLMQFENSPYYAPKLQEIFADELMPFITSFFVQGIQKGALKNIPLEISAELSFGVAISLAKQHIRGTIKLDDETIDAAANASWDALKA